MMTYRDDRDALKEQVRTLEGQIATARKEGEADAREHAETRAQELEKKLASVREEMDRMEAELRQLRGPKPQSGSKSIQYVALGGVIAAAVVAGAVAIALVGNKPQVVSDVVQVQPPPAEPPPPVAEPPAVDPPKAPPPKASPPAVEPRTTTAKWRASVKRAEGIALAAGQPCFIEASIRTKDTNARVPHLSIACGKETLYDTSQRFNGMANMGSDARERMGKTDEASTFTLEYRDIGTRSGRAQAQINTLVRQAEVWSDNLPRFRVELTPQVESEPTKPLAGAEQRLHMSGQLNEVTGALAIKSGAECVLRAMPTGQKTSCVADLSCGSAVLLPRNTPARCTYEGDKPVSVAVDSGQVLLEMTDSKVTVKSEGPKSFTAELSLASQ